MGVREIRVANLAMVHPITWLQLSVFNESLCANVRILVLFGFNGLLLILLQLP